MAYSMKRYQNDSFEFPAPPMWLVWLGDEGRHHKPAPGAGQIRHMPTLAKAKAYVSPARCGLFYADWSIYEWQNDKWVERYAGRRGDDPKSNPLWGKRFTKAEREVPARDVLDDEVAEALASIQTAVR